MPGAVGEEDGIVFGESGWSGGEGGCEDAVSGGDIVGCLEAVVEGIALWKVGLENGEKG